MATMTYTFGGTLVLDTALHIGSGGGGTSQGGARDVDATVIRDAAGRPYIPGSSLRGALRAALGQYGPMLGLKEIRDDADIDDAVTSALPGPPSPPPDEKALQSILADVLTSAERFVGTVHWESPLKIPDLYLAEGAAALVDVRDGVGIDRDTGAARDGAKYDFEVLTRDHTFAFHATLEIRDVPDDLATEWRRLMALALRLLELGEIRLGGNQARGIGRVHLEDTTVHVLDLGNPADLLAALTRAGRDTPAGRAEPAGWATSVLDEFANETGEDVA
jgi:CRISPR-associated RAMP protein (TIGR02581 family)